MSVSYLMQAKSSSDGLLYAWSAVDAADWVGAGYTGPGSPVDVVLVKKSGGDGSAPVINAAQGIGTAASPGVLRGIIGSASLKTLNVGGFWTIADSGGGSFYWDAASTTADDVGTCIRPVGVAFGSPGRWKRVYNGHLHVEWFGAYGDSTTGIDGHDDTAAFQAAIDVAKARGGAHVALAYGKGYRVATSLDFNSSSGVSMGGTGNPTFAGGSTLYFSGAPQSSYINARSSIGFSLRNLTIRCVNMTWPPAALPGDTTYSVVQTGGGGGDSGGALIDRVNFFGAVGGLCKRIIHLRQTLSTTVRNCTFQYSEIGIYGTSLTDGYANVITVQDNVFIQITQCAIFGPGQVWHVIGNTCETFPFMDNDASSSGPVTITANWLGDESSTPRWIRLTGILGLTISGNVMGICTDAAIKLDAVLGASVHSNWFLGGKAVIFTAVNGTSNDVVIGPNVFNGTDANLVGGGSNVSQLRILSNTGSTLGATRLDAGGIDSAGYIYLRGNAPIPTSGIMVSSFLSAKPIYDASGIQGCGISALNSSFGDGSGIAYWPAQNDHASGHVFYGYDAGFATYLQSPVATFNPSGMKLRGGAYVNALTGHLDVGAMRVINVADPTGAQHAATKAYADSTSAILLFGDGSDGNLTASSGTTTLTKDTYYGNVTLSGSGKIDTGAYRLFVSGTLDISAAGAGAIFSGGTSGAGGAGSSAGTGGAAGFVSLGSATIGGGNNGSAGGIGSNGAGVQAAAPANVTPSNGGSGGLGAAGGAGLSGAGGSSRAGGAASVTMAIHRHMVDTLRGASLIFGGAPGAGGGGGGGDGTTGAGGGGGAASGGVIWIAAKTIARGASTAVAAITCAGSAGGAGGAAGAGQRGGGAGGGGGGGGWLYVAYFALTGASGTNILEASGGAGAAGGAGTGAAGIGGSGGSGGDSGRITAVNLGTGIASESAGAAGTAGTAGAGNTAGTGGAAAVLRVSL